MDDISSIIENNINNYLNKQSIIDNRHSNKLSSSIIDMQTDKLRTKLGDPSLHPGQVAKALNVLGEGKVLQISDWCSRAAWAHHKGKLFVSQCEKAISAKQAV